MTLNEEIILAIIDKAVIGIIVILIGYWIIKKIEVFKIEQTKIRELEKQRDELELKLKLDKREKNLSFIEQQINEFFWPAYIRLEKDNVLWEKVPKLKKSENSLPEDANDLIEKEILDNHTELVKLFESKIHLIDNDNELFKEILAYLKHIAIYKTIRKVESLKNKNPEDLNEAYPKNLFILIKNKMDILQNKYNKHLNNL